MYVCKIKFIKMNIVSLLEIYMYENIYESFKYVISVLLDLNKSTLGIFSLNLL